MFIELKLVLRFFLNEEVKVKAAKASKWANFDGTLQEISQGTLREGLRYIFLVAKSIIDQKMELSWFISIYSDILVLKNC